jgi:transposase
MSEDRKLTNRQLLAIPHIISSFSIQEAFQKAKVSRITLYNWLKEENFKAELKRQRDEIIRSALERLESAITKAVKELIN